MEGDQYQILLNRLRSIHKNSVLTRIIDKVLLVRFQLIAIGLCIISVFFLYNDGQIEANATDVTRKSLLSTEIEKVKISPGDIFIDVSGAVYSSGVYKVPTGTRLYEVLEKAKGLSESADVPYFERNFNRALIVQDQMKVHVPSVMETTLGIYQERQKIVTAISRTNPAIEEKMLSDKGAVRDIRKISMNNATQAELESLTGVGKITAERIMAARPYRSIEELVNNDIISQSLLEKIQGQIDL